MVDSKEKDKFDQEFHLFFLVPSFTRDEEKVIDTKLLYR